MRGVFLGKWVRHHPQAKLLVFQSSFAVGDQCLEEICCGLVEETEVCTPRHVADDVDSGLPHLDGHGGVPPGSLLLTVGLVWVPLRGRTAKPLRRVNGSNARAEEIPLRHGWAPLDRARVEFENVSTAGSA